MLLAAILTGCAGLYKGSITLTAVVDSMMRNWAEMSVQGFTTPQIDEAVVKAHNRYREAAKVARKALEAYKAGGDVSGYVAAFAAAKEAADGIFEIIRPILAQHQVGDYQMQLNRAKTP